MAHPSKTTAEALEGLTDSAVFEKLATAVARFLLPGYDRTIHIGINVEGKAVKAPIDGIALLGTKRSHFLVSHHTTVARSALERKWLRSGKPKPGRRASRSRRRADDQGDVIKTIAWAKALRKEHSNCKVTLLLTTNRVPSHALIESVTATTRKHRIEVEFLDNSQIAHFLDNTPDGQWLREAYLGIEAQRVSEGLLRTICQKSLTEYKGTLFSTDPTWIARALDERLSASVQASPITLLVASSGMGKSTAAWGVLNRHIDNGGIGLWISHTVVDQCVTLNEALDVTLNAFAPRLSNDCTSATLAFAKPDSPIVFVIDDVNRSHNPGALIERILGWAQQGGDPARSNPNPIRILCPVWPESLTLLSEQSRKAVEAAQFLAAGFSPEEGQKAVQARAAAEGLSVTDLEARTLSAELGNDPLLIATLAFDEESSASHTNDVIGAFIERQILSVAARTQQFAAPEYMSAMRALARSMILERKTEPTWNDVINWLRAAPDTLQAIRHVEASKTLIGLTHSEQPALAFRHDRLRDWFLAAALAEGMQSDALPQDVLSDAHYASLLGKALWRSGAATTWIERLATTNPLALFYSLITSNPDETISTQICQRLSEWVRNGEQTISKPQRMIWAAHWVLAQGESPLIRRIAESVPHHNLFTLEAAFRNGNFRAGALYCVWGTFGTTSRRRDELISHVFSKYGDAFVRSIQQMLSDPHPQVQLGALHLAGYLGDCTLADAIGRCWSNTSQREENLPSFLFAALRCTTPPNGPLEDMFAVWASLPDTHDESSLSPRALVSAYDLTWACRRGLSPAVLAFLDKQAQRPELQSHVIGVLEDIDHPMAFRTVIRDIAVGLKASNGRWPLTSMITDKWSPARGHGRTMSTASREFLRGEWGDSKHNKYIRRTAYVLWAANGRSADLPALKKIHRDDLLYEPALAKRIELLDYSCLPALRVALKGHRQPGYFLQFCRNWRPSELVKVVQSVIERLQISSSEADVGFDVYILSELLMRLHSAEAEKILVEHWAKLKSYDRFVHAALFVGTRATLDLAHSAVSASANPENLFKHVTMHIGVGISGRADMVTLAKLDNLKPYFGFFGDQLHQIWEFCNQRGWHTWRRKNVDPILTQPIREKFGMTKEAVLRRLDGWAKSAHPHTEYWVRDCLKRGDTHAQIINVLKEWLDDRRSIQAMTVVADALNYVGRRSDLAILDGPQLPNGNDANLIRANASFAVHLRTLE